MLEWLQNNGGCRLPCIWGLTPGVTDTQARRLHLARFGKVSESGFSMSHSVDDQNPGGFGFSFTKDDLHVSMGLSYSERNNIIDSMVMVTWPSRDNIAVFGESYYEKLLGYYRLPQLLSNYGRPSEVLVGTWNHDPLLKADYDPFSVVVIYDQLGIMAEYIAPNKLVGSYLQGCPTQGYLTLRTWDPKEKIPLAKIAAMGAGEGINENAMDYFKPVDTVTSITLDEFYQKFRDPTNIGCLETPADLWGP